MDTIQKNNHSICTRVLKEFNKEVELLTPKTFYQLILDELEQLHDEGTLEASDCNEAIALAIG